MIIPKSYLYDKAFLKELDLQQQRIEYVKIIVLDWEDNPIQSIEGLATGGNLSLNGSSAIRRTGSLTLAASSSLYNITDINNLIAINKRVEIEKGILNQTPYYNDEEIIWFSLGIYIISSANISSSVNDINISISLKDKMSLLNGECGGTYLFETVLSEGGDDSPKLKELIETAVNQIGGIPKDKIHIFDVEDRIKNSVRWNGSSSLYIEEKVKATTYSFSTIEQKGKGWTEYPHNSNIGYKMTDLTYPADKELIMQAGDTVVTLLDKIKSVLGNYEYFFDIEGNFIFQQVKDYINDGSSIDNLEEAINDKYLINASEINKSQYTLGSDLITSISNAPIYQNVKNDIILWGKQKQADSSTKDICYHLIIDEKPTASKKYSNIVFYKRDGEDYYRAKQDPNGLDIEVTDWRCQAYFDIITTGTSNYPYLDLEIENFFPQIYNIKDQTFGDNLDLLWFNNLPYFIDMLDTNAVSGPIKDIAISRIGRRPQVLKEDSVNCLFSPRFPDIIYIQAGQGSITAAERSEALEQEASFVQLPQTIMKSIGLGSYLYSAYDAVRSNLHTSSSYNETINISCIPIYYLDTNIRITVEDAGTGVNGDYLIQSISIPLTFDGTMNITAKKAIERI